MFEESMYCLAMFQKLWLLVDYYMCGVSLKKVVFLGGWKQSSCWTKNCQNTNVMWTKYRNTYVVHYLFCVVKHWHRAIIRSRSALNNALCMMKCAQCRFLQGAIFVLVIDRVGAFVPLSPVYNPLHSWRHGCSLPLKLSERILVYRTSPDSTACNLQGSMSDEHTLWSIFIIHAH